MTDTPIATDTSENKILEVIPTSMTGIMLHDFANLAPEKKAPAKTKTRLGPKLPGVPRETKKSQSASFAGSGVNLSGRSFISTGRRGSGPAHG